MPGETTDPATPSLDAGPQRPRGGHQAQPRYLPPAQAPSAGSTPACKAHRPRSRRGAGRGPPRLRTAPSYCPSESGRTQRHVTAASVQDGGCGQASQAARLSPSPGMRPLSAQARALDRWAGTGLPSRAGQGQGPCFQLLPAPCTFSTAKHPGAGACSVLWSPRLLGLAASAANGVRDMCGKAGRGGASLLFVGRLAWPLASAGRGAGTDGAVLWGPADQ